MQPAPESDQACYDLGYDNPSVPARIYRWKHVVLTNAYYCGQMDRQNQQPRNRKYDRVHYDPETHERAIGLPGGDR